MITRKMFESGALAKKLVVIALASFIGISCGGNLRAHEAGKDVCVRSAPGSAVTEPPDLRSHDGVLQVERQSRSSGFGAFLSCEPLRGKISFPRSALWKQARPADWADDCAR